jgi:fido (protein-threonine AMPylation protein)
MPHRAGYFVLAYSWDHHCRRLYDRLEGQLRQVGENAAGIERDESGGSGTGDLHQARWQDVHDSCRLVLSEIRRREYVINSLGYRGYGVNHDLLKGLEALDRMGARLEAQIEGHFRADMGRPLHETLQPKRDGAFDADFDRYRQVMARETSISSNTAIFQRMFFAGGCSSMTIMKGSTGLHDGRSVQEMKMRANADFVHTVRDLFAGLGEYTEIGIEMLRGLHRNLMKSLDPNGGFFRHVDFPDRNGVTFEFDNFRREVTDLAIVLAETARSFHDSSAFIYNLARSYYMLIGIHPFWDCNGRVGRTFLNYMFLKKGLPPITLNGEEEVFVLPRYGGSMEDMHDYLKKRLDRAIGIYFSERSKLGNFGLTEKRIYNTSFDSGFHFRQIDDYPGRIEVDFEAFVIDDRDERSRAFKDECRVVLPEVRLLHNMTVHCGLCDTPFSRWRHSFTVKKDFHVRELVSDVEGARIFDIDFLVDIPEKARHGDIFACSVVSEESQNMFNNKGLNYSFRLDL